MTVDVEQPYVHAEAGSRVLTQGMRGDDVMRIQRFLGIAETGRMGERTRAKVMEYQKRVNLEPTGDVDKETWAAAGFVRMRKWPLKDGQFFGPETEGGVWGRTVHEQRMVEAIQAKLGIALTGEYSPTMKMSVMRRQRMMGLNPTGLVDRDTWVALF